MRQKTQLTDVHWKALELLEAGTLSLADIATECGWSKDFFYDLKSGNIAKCGYIADVFNKEWKQIEVKRDSTIKKLVKENTESAQLLIKQVLAELKLKKKLDSEEKKLVSMYTNALAKCTPSVSIGSLSYSYTKGLNPEDLIREFKRLETIASQSFNRRGVPEASEGGAGTLSGVDEPGN